MRITSKGQVTIPQAIREQAGLMPHTEVEFEFDGEAVRIVPSNITDRAGRPRSRGDRAVALLWGKGDVRMTTDEILALTAANRRASGPGRQQRSAGHPHDGSSLG